MQENRLLIGIVALIALIGGIAYFALARDSERRVHADPLDAYFEERLTTLGVEDIGQPIEGFDSGLLIMAFPGLTVRDFDGVETLEGKYAVIEGNIEFVRTDDAPITSAERAVSPAGYETLLDNVSKRVGIEPVSTSSVDAIVLAINTGEHVETRIGEGGSALSVTVVPQEVLEDSRCPSDVQCIQAGTVRLRTLLTSGLGEGRQIFILGEPITTETEEITLKRVAPERQAGVEIKPDEYRFIFEVKKRSS